MKIAGTVLLILGLVWMFQGVGILGGSFMTGQREWLYIGIVVAVAGLAIVILGFRRPPIG